ncbi:DUF1428 domain-containing protein [Candidatus Kaiserbacteria bacterium]|nr:DUF1428 domain-containing protein [Candidatus Kaiserbacteria bacterium]
MAYVDGFVFVVKDADKDAYQAMAQKASDVWKANGALDYKECKGDDLRPKVPEGAPADMAPASFIDLLQAGPEETVWFSYIVFESRAHRDEVNAKVMQDPAMNDPAWQNMPMPFDMKRMYTGGFEVVVGA